MSPFPRATRPAPPLAVASDALRIVRAADAKEAAVKFYKFGLGNGETTHFAYLDTNWTWMKKEITALTGYPNHGKSWWMFQTMLVKAALSKWKFALYVPENEDDVFIGLAQMLVGRTANPKAGNNRMSLAELEKALDWLHDHFWLITAPEGCTPKQLLAAASELNAEVGLDGFFADPWNQLNHDFQSREDLYLSEQFSALKRFAIKEKLAVVVSAHPAGTVKNKDGVLQRPDAYSISGGKMWNNKFDNVLAQFRPDFPAPNAELWIHKIKKQGRVGTPGMIELSYDRDTFRYSHRTGHGTHPLESVSLNAPGPPAPTWNPHLIPAASDFEAAPWDTPHGPLAIAAAHSSLGTPSVRFGPPSIAG